MIADLPLSEFAVSDEDTSVMHLIRISIDSTSLPFAIQESWTIGLDSEIQPAQFEHRSRVQVIEEHGILIDYATQTLNAAKADKRIADFLELKCDEPVLSLSRRSYDNRGNLIDILHSHFHPDRFQFEMHLGKSAAYQTSVPNNIDAGRSQMNIL